MTSAPATIFVVDDDSDVRRALARLLRAAEFEVATFGSAEEFLAGHDADANGCLLLDVIMPGIDGLELQASLRAAGCPLPIIFLSGSGDIPMTVRAMKAGAVTFLTKPVEEARLLVAVSEALLVEQTARRARTLERDVQRRLLTLTPREHEVLVHVVAGRLNKQIAAHLGTAEKTVKVHRARVMQKMRAGSIAELVQFANHAGIAGKPAAWG